MEEVQLPLDNVGARLRRAREAAGLSAAQVAAETRISQRQIEAIETGNYAALPGRTYAIGFSRTYARAVGVNEVETAAAVREELAQQQPEDPRRPVQTFEPGDPARVPSSGLTWLALGGLALAVIAALLFVPGLFAPSASLPSILPGDASSQPAVANIAPLAAVPSGPVVFTAALPAVWVKFSNAAGQQLMQKELALGESYTVPADQGEVRLWTARPDALDITIGGQPVAKLSDLQKTMKDVPVSAAALLARGAAPAAASMPLVPAASAPLAGAPAGDRSAVPIAPRRTAVRAPTVERSQEQSSEQRSQEQRNPTPRTELSPLPAPPAAAPAPTASAAPSTPAT